MHYSGFGPNAEISFDSSGWKKERVLPDAGGYYITYTREGAPEDPQKILLNYGRNLKMSLNASLASALEAEKKSGCKNLSHNVIATTENSMTFSTSLSGCPASSPEALYTIRKVFNEPDGQYSILYSAIPTKVSQGAIDSANKMVADANLKPIY
jgi:hypothetical protein